MGGDLRRPEGESGSFLGAMQPWARLIFAASHLGPLTWLFVLTWSAPPERFVESWLLVGRYSTGFACAALASVWLTLTSLLLLTGFPRPAGLVLIPGADRRGFVRQAATLALVYRIGTCWAGLLWWLL